MGFVGSFPRICWPARVVSLQLASVLPRKGTCAILAFSSRSHLCLWRLRAFDLLLTWIFRFHWLSSSCTHCNRRTRIMVFEIAFKQKRVVDDMNWLFAGQFYVYVEDIAKEKVVGLYVALGQLYLIGWCGNQINWLNLKSLHLSIFVPLTLATDGECNTWSNISLNFSFFTPMQLGWGFKGHNKDTTCIGT